MIGEDRTGANVTALVAFAYSLPTYLLYILMIYSILYGPKKSDLSTSFYKLFCLSAVINIIFHITSYFYLRAVNIPLFIPVFRSLPEIGFFMTFIPVICYHCGVAVSLIDFFISLNRFTVILMKVNHKEFWRKIMPWIYVIVLILPNLFTWHFWLTDIRNEMYNASDPDQGYYWDQYATENVPWMQNSRNMSIVIFGCAFPSCCMNFYVCFHLIKQKLSKTYSTSTYSEKQNVQLLIYTLLIFITEIGLGFVMLSFTVSTDAVFLEYVYSYMHYMFDIVSLAPAWFLFIVDGMIRTAIFQICVSKNISNTAIPAGIITSSVQSNVNVNNNMNMELPVIP